MQNLLMHSLSSIFHPDIHIYIQPLNNSVENLDIQTTTYPINICKCASEY